MKKLQALLYAFLFCTAPVWAQYSPAGGGGGGVTTFTSNTGLSTNTAATGAVTVTNTAPNIVIPAVDNFRLVGTTGSFADTASTTTIYATPYNGNHISLYNGSAWVDDTSAEFTLALGTITAALPYDVFCYDVAGTPTLELLAWTNGTTRATALVQNSGVWSKSGALTRRYLGTFYTLSTTTTCDIPGSRYIFNANNRLTRRLYAADPATSWTYKANAPRAADANTTEGQGRVGVVLGLSEEAVTLSLTSFINTGSTTNYSQAIGVNSTTVPSTSGTVGFSYNAALYTMLTSNFSGVPAVGYSYLQALENNDNTSTVTVYGAGTSGGGNLWTCNQEGMTGTIRN